MHYKELHDFIATKLWIGRTGCVGRWKVEVYTSTYSNTDRDLGAPGYEGGDGINLVEDTDSWAVRLYSVTELRDPQREVKFLTS